MDIRLLIRMHQRLVVAKRFHVVCGVFEARVCAWDLCLGLYTPV